MIVSHVKRITIVLKIYFNNKRIGYSTLFFYSYLFYSLLYLIIKLSNSCFISSSFSLSDDSYLVVILGPVLDFLTKAKPSSYSTLIPSILE